MQIFCSDRNRHGTFQRDGRADRWPGRSADEHRLQVAREPDRDPIRSRKELAVHDPMIENVEPAEKGMPQGPQYAVVDAPAEEGGEHRTDAPEYPSPAATASLRVVVAHILVTR